MSRKILTSIRYHRIIHILEKSSQTDVVVEANNPLLLREFRIGLQVFSYEGTVEEWGLQEKLEQLFRGWEENSLDYGVLLTTGHCSKAAVVALHKHNKEKPDRLVRLIEGNELADLFLKYFPPGDLEQSVA